MERDEELKSSQDKATEVLIKKLYLLYYGNHFTRDNTEYPKYRTCFVDAQKRLDLSTEIVELLRRLKDSVGEDIEGEHYLRDALGEDNYNTLKLVIPSLRIPFDIEATPGEEDLFGSRLNKINLALDPYYQGLHSPTLDNYIYSLANFVKNLTGTTNEDEKIKNIVQSIHSIYDSIKDGEEELEQQRKIDSSISAFQEVLSEDFPIYTLGYISYLLEDLQKVAGENLPINTILALKNEILNKIKANISSSEAPYLQDALQLFYKEQIENLENEIAALSIQAQELHTILEDLSTAAQEVENINFNPTYRLVSSTDENDEPEFFVNKEELLAKLNEDEIDIESAVKYKNLCKDYIVKFDQKIEFVKKLGVDGVTLGSLYEQNSNAAFAVEYYSYLIDLRLGIDNPLQHETKQDLELLESSYLEFIQAKHLVELGLLDSTEESSYKALFEEKITTLFDKLNELETTYVTGYNKRSAQDINTPEPEKTKLKEYLELQIQMRSRFKNLVAASAEQINLKALGIDELLDFEPKTKSYYLEDEFNLERAADKVSDERLKLTNSTDTDSKSLEGKIKKLTDSGVTLHYLAEEDVAKKTKDSIELYNLYLQYFKVAPNAIKILQGRHDAAMLYINYCLTENYSKANIGNTAVKNVVAAVLVNELVEISKTVASIKNKFDYDKSYERYKLAFLKLNETLEGFEHKFGELPTSEDENILRSLIINIGHKICLLEEKYEPPREADLLELESEAEEERDERDEATTTYTSGYMLPSLTARIADIELKKASTVTEVPLSKADLSILEAHDEDDAHDLSSSSTLESIIYNNFKRLLETTDIKAAKQLLIPLRPKKDRERALEDGHLHPEGTTHRFTKKGNRVIFKDGANIDYFHSVAQVFAVATDMPSFIADKKSINDDDIHKKDLLNTAILDFLYDYAVALNYANIEDQRTGVQLSTQMLDNYIDINKILSAKNNNKKTLLKVLKLQAKLCNKLHKAVTEDDFLVPEDKAAIASNYSALAFKYYSIALVQFYVKNSYSENYLDVTETSEVEKVLSAVVNTNDTVFGQEISSPASLKAYLKLITEVNRAEFSKENIEHQRIIKFAQEASVKLIIHLSMADTGEQPENLIETLVLALDYFDRSDEEKTHTNQVLVSAIQTLLNRNIDYDKAVNGNPEAVFKIYSKIQSEKRNIVSRADSVSILTDTDSDLDGVYPPAAPVATYTVTADDLKFFEAKLKARKLCRSVYTEDTLEEDINNLFELLVLIKEKGKIDSSWITDEKQALFLANYISELAYKLHSMDPNLPVEVPTKFKASLNFDGKPLGVCIKEMLQSKTSSLVELLESEVANNSPIVIAAHKIDFKLLESDINEEKLKEYADEVIYEASDGLNSFCKLPTFTRGQKIGRRIGRLLRVNISLERDLQDEIDFLIEQKGLTQEQVDIFQKHSSDESKSLGDRAIGGALVSRLKALKVDTDERIVALRERYIENILKTSKLKKSKNKLTKNSLLTAALKKQILSLTNEQENLLIERLTYIDYTTDENRSVEERERYKNLISRIDKLSIDIDHKKSLLRTQINSLKKKPIEGRSRPSRKTRVSKRRNSHSQLEYPAAASLTDDRNDPLLFGDPIYSSTSASDTDKPSTESKRVTNKKSKAKKPLQPPKVEKFVYSSDGLLVDVAGSGSDDEYNDDELLILSRTQDEGKKETINLEEGIRNNPWTPGKLRFTLASRLFGEKYAQSMHRNSLIKLARASYPGEDSSLSDKELWFSNLRKSEYEALTQLADREEAILTYNQLDARVRNELSQLNPFLEETYLNTRKRELTDELNAGREILKQELSKYPAIYVNPWTVEETKGTWRRFVPSFVRNSLRRYSDNGMFATTRALSDSSSGGLIAKEKDLRLLEETIIDSTPDTSEYDIVVLKEPHHTKATVYSYDTSPEPTHEPSVVDDTSPEPATSTIDDTPAELAAGTGLFSVEELAENSSTHDHISSNDEEQLHLAEPDSASVTAATANTSVIEVHSDSDTGLTATPSPTLTFSDQEHEDRLRDIDGSHSESEQQSYVEDTIPVQHKKKKKKSTRRSKLRNLATKLAENITTLLTKIWPASVKQKIEHSVKIIPKHEYENKYIIDDDAQGRTRLTADTTELVILEDTDEANTMCKLAEVTVQDSQAPNTRDGAKEVVTHTTDSIDSDESRINLCMALISTFLQTQNFDSTAPNAKAYLEIDEPLPIEIAATLLLCKKMLLNERGIEIDVSFNAPQLNTQESKALIKSYKKELGRKFGDSPPVLTY